MNINAVLQRRQDLLSADMSGETIMLDLISGKYYNLGKVGGVIWEMLKEASSVEKLIHGLVERYQISVSQCEHDVLPFLESLIQKGLVEILEPDV